jgi:hypothetical protein
MADRPGLVSEKPCIGHNFYRIANFQFDDNLLGSIGKRYAVDRG